MTDDVFAVIAEATRRDILVSLRKGDKAVGELVQELEASQPTISKHLKVLREADLVSMRAQGQKRYYTLNPKPLAGIASWLETFDVGAAAPAPELSPVRTPDHRLQTVPDTLAEAATSAPAPASQPAAALAGRAAGSPLSPAVVLPVGTAGRGQNAAADRPHRRPGRHEGRRPPGQPAEVRPQEVALPVCVPHHRVPVTRGN